MIHGDFHSCFGINLNLWGAGLFWLQAGQTNTVAGVNNLRGLLFFELMFMAMRAMLGALFTFPSEFKMMLKVCLLIILSISACITRSCHLVVFELMFMRAMLGALFTFPSEFKMMLDVCVLAKHSVIGLSHFLKIGTPACCLFHVDMAKVKSFACNAAGEGEWHVSLVSLLLCTHSLRPAHRLHHPYLLHHHCLLHGWTQVHLHPSLLNHCFPYSRTPASKFHPLLLRHCCLDGKTPVSQSNCSCFNPTRKAPARSCTYISH